MKEKMMYWEDEEKFLEEHSVGSMAELERCEDDDKKKLVNNNKKCDIN